MKLATRLSALFCILSIIPLSVVGYLAYNNGRMALNQIATNNLKSVNTLKQSQLEEWISSDMREVKELAQHMLIADSAIILANEVSVSPEFMSARKKVLQDYFLPTLRQNAGFGCFFLIRARDGRILVSTKPDEEGRYMKTEPYFNKQTGQPHIQDTYYWVDSRNTIMHIGASVTDRRGNLIAIVGGYADLKGLTTLMRHEDGSSSSVSTCLIDESRTWISWSSEAGGTRTRNKRRNRKASRPASNKRTG